MRVFYDHIPGSAAAAVTDAYEGMHQVTGSVRCPECGATHLSGTRPRWLKVRADRVLPWWFKAQSPKEAKALIQKWARRWNSGSMLVQWKEAPSINSFGHQQVFYEVAIYHCQAARIEPVNEQRPQGLPARV